MRACDTSHFPRPGHEEAIEPAKSSALRRPPQRRRRTSRNAGGAVRRAVDGAAGA
jgi:hypothetical protein